jgi:hypothetical protein
MVPISPLQTRFLPPLVKNESPSGRGVVALFFWRPGRGLLSLVQLLLSACAGSPGKMGGGLPFLAVRAGAGWHRLLNYKKPRLVALLHDTLAESDQFQQCYHALLQEHM